MEQNEFLRKIWYKINAVGIHFYSLNSVGVSKENDIFEQFHSDIQKKLTKME
jgi:hypothetical protein